MDLVIREYEVNSRQEGALLIAQLQETGCNVKFVIGNASKAARIPELSYYCVWTDGTITRGDTSLDMDEVKAVNYQLVAFTPGTQIETLKTIN